MIERLQDALSRSVALLLRNLGGSVGKSKIFADLSSSFGAHDERGVSFQA